VFEQRAKSSVGFIFGPENVQFSKKHAFALLTHMEPSFHKGERAADFVGPTKVRFFGVYVYNGLFSSRYSGN
jgi:hypothetical protein